MRGSNLFRGRGQGKKQWILSKNFHDIKVWKRLNHLGIGSQLWSKTIWYKVREWDHTVQGLGRGQKDKTKSIIQIYRSRLTVITKKV